MDAPLVGGQLQCAYCDVVSYVVPRPAYESAQVLDRPLEGEGDRHQALLHQLAGYTDAPESNPYGLWPPSGLEVFHDLAIADNVFIETAQKAWRQAWEQNNASGGAQQDQHRLCYLAQMLNTGWTLRREPRRRRAVLESALDVVTLPGFRHILYCAMANAACQEGDLESAEYWLSKCDPLSWILDLDVDYQTAKANICIKRQDWNGVLDVLHNNMVVTPTSYQLVLCMRAVAFERTDRPQAAEDQFLNLGSDLNQVLDDTANVTEAADALMMFDRAYAQVIAEAHPRDLGACIDIWDRANRRARATLALAPQRRVGIAGIALIIAFVVAMFFVMLAAF